MKLQSLLTPPVATFQDSCDQVLCCWSEDEQNVPWCYRTVANNMSDTQLLELNARAQV